MNMNTESPITLKKGGRAFPDAVSGLPANANELNEISEDFIDMDDDDTDSKEKTIPKAIIGDKLNADIVEAAERIIELREDLKSINKKIKQVFTGVEQKGILAESLKHSIKSMSWSDAKRESYKFGCDISGNALGIMEQTELFSVK